MKVVVIGSGLLGTGIANRLALQGNSVAVLSPHRNLLLDPGVRFAHGRVELGRHLGDILTDIEVVIDAASSLVPATVQQSPATAITSSVAVTSWLAQEAVDANVGCYIYLSSGGTIYGAGLAPHSEQELPDPVSAYGAMKVACEYAIMAITRSTNTRSVFLRVSNAYGPGQNLSRPQGIIGVAWRNHMNNVPTILYGAESTVRDFIYVDDVGDLCATAIRSGYQGAINAGSGRGTSLADVLDKMSEIAGADIQILHQAARGYDVPFSVLDIRLAQGLGWSPDVSLRHGLERTWTWLKATAT